MTRVSTGCRVGREEGSRSGEAWLGSIVVRGTFILHHNRGDTAARTILVWGWHDRAQSGLNSKDMCQLMGGRSSSMEGPLPAPVPASNFPCSPLALCCLCRHTALLTEAKRRQRVLASHLHVRNSGGRGASWQMLRKDRELTPARGPARVEEVGTGLVELDPSEPSSAAGPAGVEGFPVCLLQWLG